MTAPEPINPRVRLAIALWPDDAPRGAVSTFYAEHGISRKSFYDLRKRARADGPAAVLEPKSRRPKSSPSKLTEQVKNQAVQVRAALEASGLDHGPISVHDEMHMVGLEVVPSIASLARISRQAGVARIEPHKKPRSTTPAMRSRPALPGVKHLRRRSRACDKAVAAHGVPQRLLFDNGLALNPSRRGYQGHLVAHVSSLGTEAIALADTLATLQGHVDTFDHLYNTQRPHQALPSRLTPLTAREATPTAEDPRPRPARPFLVPAAVRRLQPVPAPKDLPAGTRVRKLTGAGNFMLAGVKYRVGGVYGFQHVLTVVDRDTITVVDLEGEILIEHTRPAPGITGRPSGPRPPNRHRSPDTATFTHVLIQNCHPSPEISQVCWGRLGRRQSLGSRVDVGERWRPTVRRPPDDEHMTIRRAA